MKVKQHKPRNVNLEPVRLDNGTMIYPGDSLVTVLCPKSIMKRMRHNLYQIARRSQVTSSIRQRIARDLIEELKLKRNM